MPEIATLHLVLGWLAAGAALLTVAVGAATATGRLASRHPIDRSILALLAATGGNIVVGLPLLVTGRGPADPLHLVYGVVAVVAVPIARAIAGGHSTSRIGRDVAVGGLVVLGAMLRLFMTGR